MPTETMSNASGNTLISKKDTNTTVPPKDSSRAFLGSVVGIVCGGVLVAAIAMLTPYLSLMAGYETLAYAILAVILVSSALAGGFGAYAIRLRRHTQKINEGYKAALEVNKAKDEFTSMVLHHLRTPLAGMRWMISEVIRGKRYPADVKEIFDTLYETDKRALAAVSHLLDVARTSMALMEYEVNEISVKELQAIARKNVEMYAEHFKESGITLKKNFARSVEGSVMIDKEKFATVVATLVENALHYTSKGGTITTTSKIEGKQYLFTVSDTGIGIPSVDKDRIFLQFYRSENAIKKNPEGFGVGLYLAKTFLERQKGSITVVSEEGKGTAFTLHIPLRSLSTPETLKGSEDTAFVDLASAEGDAMEKAPAH